MRRLNLLPITSPNGSLHHFYRLNPSLLSHEKIPGGTVIVLPITKLPPNSESHKHFWKQKNSFVFFRRNPNWVPNRHIASHEKPLHFGTGKMKVRVKKDSKLVRDFLGSGYANPSDLDGYVVLEVPVSTKPFRRLSRKRRPKRLLASVDNEEPVSSGSSIKTEAKVPSNFALEVGTQLITRQYSISTETGESGTISSFSAPAILIGGKYERGWLDLSVQSLIENESVESSAQVSINQEASTRTDLGVNQNWKVGKWNVATGFGFADTPVLFSASTTLLNLGYVSNPYINVGAKRAFNLISGLESAAYFGGRYFLGGTNGAYELGSGYEGRIGLELIYPYSKSLQFIGGSEVSYQDSGPTFYDQTVIGASINVGLIWGF